MRGHHPIQPKRDQDSQKVRPQTNLFFALIKELERWYSLVLVVLTLGVFWPTVSMGFTYDDLVVVLDDPRIWQLDFWGLWFGNGQIIPKRQIRTLSYMLDYSLFGSVPAGYHLHNLFWHVLCVLLVFHLIKKLTHQPSFSFFGALIFAVHPIHVESVANITNRKEMLALAFFLVSFLSYTKFLEEKRARKWVWLLAGVVSWALAIYSKQIAIVLPLLLVVFEYIIVPKNHRFLTKNTAFLLILLGLGGGVLSLYVFVILDASIFTSSKFVSTGLNGYRGELTYFSLVFTSALVFWTYIQSLIWPLGLCPNYVVDLSSSLFDLQPLLAWLGLITYILIMLWLSTRWPLLAFGMIWFFISFIPLSNWVPSLYILADRYMYMPSVGYCIVLVALGQALYQWLITTQRRKAVGIGCFLAAVLAGAYTTNTLAYLPHWSQQQTLLTYMLQCNPESAQAYNGLGKDYFSQGRYGKAIEQFSQAIKLGHVHAYTNRGNAFYQLGEYRAALNDYTHAISQMPDEGKPYNNRGTVYYEMGDHQAALVDYHQAMLLKPNWGEPYVNRGILYLAQKQYDLAVYDFNKAVERSRDKSRIMNLRGLAHEKMGDWTTAQEDYQRAIAWEPSNAEAFFNLGRVQLHEGELEAAILSYQKSKELGWERAEDVLRVLRKKGYQ